jgi:hypothetical protein
MDGNSNQITPLAREKGLVVRELDGELLIYDRERDVAHCLKGVQAAVWKNSDGMTSIADLVAILSGQLGTSVDEYTVYRALADLGKNQLLDNRAASSNERGGMSRRDMMAKTGLAAAAAIPLITSLAVPGSAFAATCTHQGGSCTSSSQCCPNSAGKPGCCYKSGTNGVGVCGICSGGCCQIGGGICATPVLVCSG